MFNLIGWIVEVILEAEIQHENITHIWRVIEWYNMQLLWFGDKEW